MTDKVTLPKIRTTPQLNSFLEFHEIGLYTFFNSLIITIEEYDYSGFDTTYCEISSTLDNHIFRTDPTICNLNFSNKIFSDTMSFRAKKLPPELTQQIDVVIDTIFQNNSSYSYIEMVETNSPFHNLGFMNYLLNYILQKYPNNGFWLLASSFGTNAVSKEILIAFYNKYGFEFKPEFETLVQNLYLDNSFMFRI
jgi:hypothetical protein